MKNILIFSSLGVSFICGLFVFQSHRNSSTLQSLLEQERYTRFVTEEKLQKVQSEMATMQAKLAKAQQGLEKNRLSFREGQQENTHLKTQLDQMTHFKDSLEEKIQELQNIQSAPISTPPEGMEN